MPPDRFRWRLFFALGFGQALLAIAMTIESFGSEMARFDTGAPASIGARIAGALAQVLAFPLIPLAFEVPLAWRPTGFPGEHLLFLANGLIWAAAILALRRFWLAHAARESSKGPG